MVDAFNIVHDRIARSRLAGDPPDVMINPRLAKIGLFDFHRADELIKLGEAAATRALADLRDDVERADATGAVTDAYINRSSAVEGAKRLREASDE